jgi:hypothetical protein
VQGLNPDAFKLLGRLNSTITAPTVGVAHDPKVPHLGRRGVGDDLLHERRQLASVDKGLTPCSHSFAGLEIQFRQLTWSLEWSKDIKETETRLKKKWTNVST